MFIGSKGTLSLVLWGQTLKQRPSQIGRGLTFSDFSSQKGIASPIVLAHLLHSIAGPTQPNSRIQKAVSRSHATP